MRANEEQFSELVKQLRAAPGLAQQLPPAEAALVQDALKGMGIYALAQQHQISEDAVWTAMSNAARYASGQALPQVDVGGGLGSDPSPGEDEPL